MPVTTGMKADGYYDRHSAPQMAAISCVLPWLEEAIGEMQFNDRPDPIVVVDYACSEGLNSITVMQRIIAALRNRTQRPIQTVHSDLPTNNFNQLFANLSPQGRTVFIEPAVYSAAVGGSMFDQIMPPGTVTMATTFNAIGYLDSMPAVPIPDYILPMGPARPRPGVGVSAEARLAFSEQAHRDLLRFYLARAAEMVPGGKLLVASFGVNQQYRCCDGVYDLVNDALIDLVDRGRLERRAYERLVFPVYFRSCEELVAPLTQKDSQVSKCFKLDRVDSMEVPVPFSQRWHRTGDLAAYAADFTSFLWAFSEPIIRMACHDQADLEGLLKEIHDRLRSRLMENPSAYEFHYIQVAALTTRVG